MNAAVKIETAAEHRKKAREHLSYALHLMTRRRDPWIDQRFGEMDDDEIEYRRWQARQEYCRYRTLTGRPCNWTPQRGMV